MLRELHIANLAVIEDAAIELDAGLNVFTGQTGAGKSLVIGAFEILLGLRAAGDALRPDTHEGRVSGVFEPNDTDTTDAIGDILDQTIAPGEQLLITRKLFASGRSSATVNGQPATAGMIKRVGQLLVDIHGQHDHQHLLKPANQTLILDNFARCDEQRQQFADTLRKLRDLEHEQAELTASQTLRRQQLELYQFQADEIDNVDPQAGELPELQARYQVLSNLQRIKQDAGSAHAALYESEGSIVERLQLIAHMLNELSELDDHVEPTAQQVRDATLSLEEAAFELRRYSDRLDDDPAELSDVGDRLNELNRLVQKYTRDATHGGVQQTGDDPVETLLEYRKQIGDEIERLRGEDKGLSQMQTQQRELRDELRGLGDELTNARKSAAKKLRPLVESQLNELGMSEAQFDVQFDTVELDENTDTDALSSAGLDSVEMVVQTNPGQRMQPMRKIASGGELSRIMLALKSILAGSDRISVIVFDEIDANIGGRLGSVIGHKLRDLAHGITPMDKTGKSGKSRKRKTSSNHRITQSPNHQILCITHLPQIAAFADQHLHISKQVAGKGKSKQTRTSVSALSGKARIEELAEMMAGKAATQTTRKQARELLEAAG